jgi:hypothetical protein
VFALAILQVMLQVLHDVISVCLGHLTSVTLTYSDYATRVTCLTSVTCLTKTWPHNDLAMCSGETCGILDFKRAREKSPGELAEALSHLDGPRREFLKEALAEIAFAAAGGAAARPPVAGARGEAKRPLPPRRATVELQAETPRKYPRRTGALVQESAVAVGGAADSVAGGRRGASATQRPQLPSALLLRRRGRPKAQAPGHRHRDADADGRVGRLGEGDAAGGEEHVGGEDVSSGGALRRSRRTPRLSAQRVSAQRVLVSSDSTADEDSVSPSCRHD